MNTATYQCSCGFSTNNEFVWNHHASTCRGNGVNWNSRFIVAIIAAIIFSASLLMPAKAQQVQPTPAPTTSVGEPPTALHRVYMPLIKSEDLVEGQPGGLPAHKVSVSWCPTCTGKAG